MDPVTAFSLAAGILQVVDVSSRALAHCRELCRDGSLAEHRDTIEVTDALVATPRTQDDIEIVTLSSKCTKVAEDLLAELRKLGLEQSGLRHAITKTVRVMRRKAFLAEKQGLLEKYRRVLETRIFIRLDTRSLKTTQDIQSLEQGVQALALGLEQGHVTVAQLLANYHRQLHEHIDRKLDSHAKAEDDRLTRTRLLDSLFFPEIVAREEQIAEAFDGTCRWIFDSLDDQESKTRPWSDFRNWLETENGVYWISGKPGAGKSTLMKYVMNKDHTSQLLANWERGTDLIVVSFFFWTAGTALQKSCTGLLRSLLYQIATQWPELANLVTSPTKESRDVIEASSSWNPLKAWTDQGLLSLLNRFLNEKPANISVCAFVDGLDEFVGDEEYLLHMVELFNQSPQCKICVSSRPEQAFRQEFRLCPQLSVQDLNREDIQQMAAGRLIPSLQRHSNLKTEGDIDLLLDELIEKASGVFLWLDLMIKDLIRGSKNGDTFEELQLRLARTPDTINGLYAHMLQKLDPLYVEECVHYCRVLITAEELGLQAPISLLTFAMAEREPWNHLVDFDLAYFAESGFNSVCQVLETRLTSRCGGLLEIENHQHKTLDQEATVQYFARRVDFVHRTAMEYVQKAYAISPVGSSALLEAKALVARGIIGTLALSDTGYNLYRFQFLPNALMDSMLAISTMSSSGAPSDNDEPAKSLQIGLVEQACQTLQNLYTFRDPNPTKKLFFDDPTFVDRFVACDSEYPRLLNSGLSIAALFGCHHYVQSCLSTGNFPADRVPDLLKAALGGFERLIRNRSPSYFFSFIPSVLTIQAILRYTVDLDPNHYSTIESLRLRPNTYCTLWGRLFYLLIFSYHIGLSASSTMQQECTDTKQKFTWCCLEVTQQLLLIGANPNTRLVLEVEIFMKPSVSLARCWMDLSPLGLLDQWEIENAELEACLRSAGGVHHKRIRFVKIGKHWYPVNDIQSQRLNQVLDDLDAEKRAFIWILGSEYGGLDPNTDALRSVLKCIAENDTIGFDEMTADINSWEESF
ncbi:MAG: hypothetical protein Q9208_008715 [Pyrenodesmia sp. 3 TL-2023]